MLRIKSVWSIQRSQLINTFKFINVPLNKHLQFINITRFENLVLTGGGAGLGPDLKIWS